MNIQADEGDGYEYEDEEDYWEGKELDGNEKSEAAISEEQWQDSTAGMYKSTNSLLHDLHALHQHRYIPSDPSTSSNSTQRMQSSMSPMASRHSNHQHYQSSYDRPKNLLPAPLAERPSLFVSHETPMPSGLDQEDISDKMDFGEVQKVKERYEDTNR